MEEFRRREDPRYLPGIFQSLIATVLGGGLLPSVRLAWEHFFHYPVAGWLEGPLAALLAALVLIPIFWLLTKAFSRLIETRSFSKTPHAKGDRLSIYVAYLGDDELSASVRDMVIASIRAELGPESVEILPAGISLSRDKRLSDDYALEVATSKARSLLKKKQGDLLIWGKVYTIPGMRPCIDLRFVSVEGDRSKAEPFGLTDKLMLEADFAPEMGAALAAVASCLAAPATRDAGKYLALTVGPVANKLAMLTQHIPETIRTDDRAALLNSYGLIQCVIGTLSGESDRLRSAVEAFRLALSELKPERVPLEWAAAQISLGTTLATLGARESGTERLEEAVEAIRGALSVLTRERAPLKWAKAQLSLGTALTTWGARDSGTERLEEAAAAFRLALSELKRERVPLEWASAQVSLGTALATLGARESGTERLEEAVEAIRGALSEQSRKRVPLAWAAAQVGLGTALATLGARESGTACLQSAVEAFRLALSELTRERAPLKWAAAQVSLGTALATLGARESGTARLESAAAAFRLALSELTRERVPLGWAVAQVSLGTALATLGERESGTERLEEAVDAIRLALSELTRERVPLGRAAAQFSLGNTLTVLGEREMGTAWLDWVATHSNVDNALDRLDELTSGTARLEEAMVAYREALEVFTLDTVPHSQAQAGLKRVTEILESRNV